jgi:hypothetical protein
VQFSGRFLLLSIALLAVSAAAAATEPKLALPRETVSLAQQLSQLSPDVRPGEALRIAQSAEATSRALARRYRVVGPALFHNFLVNTGLRQRGLCFQWTEDLLAQLQSLKRESLELHWGVARASTWREHNCVVVVAEGRPFRSGIVLDAWRHAGHLYWAPVASDHYPWHEDHSEYVRQRLLRVTATPRLRRPTSKLPRSTEVTSR